jgi:hypothetical protein
MSKKQERLQQKPWPNLRNYPDMYLRGIKENHYKPQSGQLIYLNLQRRWR